MAIIWLSILVLAIGQPMQAQEQSFRIPKGESRDAWYGFNVAGDLYLVVRTRDGSNRARVFWRTWGFGTEREAGWIAADGKLTIPISLWRGVVSARLRVEAVDDTILVLRENAKVAQSVTFKW